MKIRDAKTKRIDQGIRQGVAKALARHKLLGESIAIWEDGKVVIVTAKNIKVPKMPKSK